MKKQVLHINISHVVLMHKKSQTQRAMSLLAVLYYRFPPT